MDTRKKQNILTVIIVIALIGLAVILTSMFYDEKMKAEKTSSAVSNEVTPPKEEKENNTVKEPVEEVKENTEGNTYVGEEEKESEQEEEPKQSNDEKAIELAKKEWGNDHDATFSIDEKKGNKYYVAVKKDGNTVEWYEVDTETWKISVY